MSDPEPPTLRERLASEAGLGVIWLTLGSVALVEVAARSRPDAFVLDLQHGLWDRLSLEAAIGAAGTVPVIVRTADGSAIAIGQALDAGAEGMLAPLVETAAQAAAVVAAAHYPPRGTRSGGGVRPLARGFGAYVAQAAERITVGVMIETARGVESAAAIAATPGLDYVFIGTGDLALSLGAEGPQDERLEAACRRVLKTCRDARLPCGIFTLSTDSAIARRREGFAMAVVTDDLHLVLRGTAGAVEAFRQVVKP